MLLFMYKCTRMLGFSMQLHQPFFVCFIGCWVFLGFFLCVCVCHAQLNTRKWRGVMFCKERGRNNAEKICNKWLLVKDVGECCSPDLLAYC